jgi:Fuc2NAc and GlcNAc transferase
MLAILLCLLIVCGALGWFGGHIVKQKAASWGLVQAPNDRSSHKIPTPSGGGLGIAVAGVFGSLALWALGAEVYWSVALVVAAIGGLGFCDDLYELKAAIRFPLQFIIIGLFLWLIHPLPAFDVFAGIGLTGTVLFVVLWIAGVWWLNLFNFMDGIDGLSATQAILIFAGGCLILLLSSDQPFTQSALWLMQLVAVAVAGFTMLNWPPARVFMGDVGSNALALLIFCAAILSVKDNLIDYMTWLILPSLFVSDATITLLRRIMRREKPWKAHKQHAYQCLSRRLGHKKVTLLYGAITLLWSIPLACAAQLVPAFGSLIVLACYLPMIAFVSVSGAGSARAA